MIRYEAFIEKSWRTTGLTQLLVARIRDDGRADIGFFLVDLWCLGVKDAFLHDDGSEALLRDLLAERLPEPYRERFHPACAKKLLDGAIAYAETLGFAPHRDFRKARRALSGLDASGCPETFTFGRDGKPCYVQGPHDTPERTERVLAILEARCGPDGFTCEFLDDDEDDDLDAEVDGLDSREALREFFENLETDGPDFYEFAGLIAALHTCPNLVMPTQLLERLWGPEGYRGSDDDELHNFTNQVGAYWNYVGDTIADCATTLFDDDETNPMDVFADDFDEPDEKLYQQQVGLATVAWCRGFMRATREWPEAWSDALLRPDLAPHWAIVAAWADPTKPGHLDIIAGDHAPKTRHLPNSLLALIRALRPRPALPPLGA